jgi:L-threonylcarbamoyladenylate synthase
LRTQVLQLDPDRPDRAALAEAASTLIRGGLVAFATETVYGLGAVATNPAALAKIFQVKGRPSFNPLIVHVADAAQATAAAAEWPETAVRLTGHFWPGPLTLVLRGSGWIPSIARGGRETVAVRAPATAVALGLIAATGQPLAAPSANRSNRLSPTSAEHVLANLDGCIELVLDSGPTSVGLESTVLDLTRSPARVLRPGPILSADLELALGGLDHVEQNLVEQTGVGTASPGQLPVHYAPRTPAWGANSSDQLTGVDWPASAALLVFGEAGLPDMPGDVECLRFEDPRTAAQALYGVLHAIDASGKAAIYVLLPPELPEWAAIRDRLMRATRPLPG